MSTHTEPRDTSAVGKNPHRRSAIGTAMRVLTTVTGSEFADKYKLREPLNRIAYEGTKTGFKTIGAANRAFASAQGGGNAKRLTTTPKNYFNLFPDDEQKMIADTVREFATEILRPAAHDADAAAAAPAEILTRSAELGITMINVPEEFDGAATERGVVTNSLVAEAMAYGDMGLALPLLAPSGVATTLTQFGSDAQQKTYLPDYAGENVPQSARPHHNPGRGPGFHSSNQHLDHLDRLDQVDHKRDQHRLGPQGAGAGGLAPASRLTTQNTTRAISLGQTATFALTDKGANGPLASVRAVSVNNNPIDQDDFLKGIQAPAGSKLVAVLFEVLSAVGADDVTNFISFGGSDSSAGNDNPDTVVAGPDCVFHNQTAGGPPLTARRLLKFCLLFAVNPKGHLATVTASPFGTPQDLGIVTATWNLP